MQWQTMLATGNEHFYQKSWQQAEHYYKQAYKTLEQQWQQSPFDSELLMAWLCTCNNLSILFEVQGELQVSLQFLKFPHNCLQTIAQNQAYPEDVRLVAQIGLKKTLPPLLAFTDKYPTCDACRNKLLLQQQALEQAGVVIH